MSHNYNRLMEISRRKIYVLFAYAVAKCIVQLIRVLYSIVTEISLYLDINNF